MFVRSLVRCVFSTRNLSIYLSIYLQLPACVRAQPSDPQRRGGDGNFKNNPTLPVSIFDLPSAGLAEQKQLTLIVKLYYARHSCT